MIHLENGNYKIGQLPNEEFECPLCENKHSTLDAQFHVIVDNYEPQYIDKIVLPCGEYFCINDYPFKKLFKNEINPDIVLANHLRDLKNNAKYYHEWMDTRPVKIYCYPYNGPKDTYIEKEIPLNEIPNHEMLDMGWDSFITEIDGVAYVAIVNILEGFYERYKEWMQDHNRIY